ncbi:hypothetical protein NL676_039684 [Syzygium grande]|nr:hypothetical protein NL676_039684 [Syzygium grande]
MNKRIASLQNQVDELRSMVGHLIKQKCHNDMDASSSKETFDPKKGDVTELGATLKRPVVCLEGKISDQNAVGSSRPGKTLERSPGDERINDSRPSFKHYATVLSTDLI